MNLTTEQCKPIKITFKNEGQNKKLHPQVNQTQGKKKLVKTIKRICH